MIEEIVQPELFIVYLGSICGLVIGNLCQIFFSMKSILLPWIFFGVIIASAMIIVFVPLIALLDYNEQVQEQIDTLPCEDLEEAYNLYGKEYIKEKYQKECTEEFKWYV